jgi:hypothetical protein
MELFGRTRFALCFIRVSVLISCRKASSLRTKSMSISRKAADLRSGKLKERQERSWGKTKLGDIGSQLATERKFGIPLGSGVAGSPFRMACDFQSPWKRYPSARPVAGREYLHLWPISGRVASRRSFVNGLTGTCPVDQLC